MPGTLYFGYGSNMWLDQMKRRCKKSKYIGTAVLHDWRWIINQRHYANVIPSLGDKVYGFIFELTPEDEESLDGYEGAPRIYKKSINRVELMTSPGDGETAKKKTIDALVYIDIDSTSPDLPKKEYIGRINNGLKDGLNHGVPQSYIDKYIRRYIPPAEPR